MQTETKKPKRQPRPDWLKVRYDLPSLSRMQAALGGLHTVCTEANCPNIGECSRQRTATFLLLGKHCTRRCRFCRVEKESPLPLDEKEPQQVAEAAKRLGLRHVVVTSVTRDDLPDGGAAHFAKTVAELNQALPESAVELLIPDLQGKTASLDIVLEAGPDILGHNVETVPRLYPEVRPGADYARSLEVLRYAKTTRPGILTKTGIMVGLGETVEEVAAVMEDLVAIGCDILTIGQYLQPTPQHLPIAEYVTPEQFAAYEALGKEKGLRAVFSGPLVRSSYHAAEVMTGLASTSHIQ